MLFLNWLIITYSLLTDEDKAIYSDKILNVVLCIWHFWKNVIKDFANILETKWREFTKSFYDCISEYGVDNL